MKAVLCKEYGPPESLVLEEVADLKPGPGQVVVSVKACGINFPDTLIIQGKYQFKPAMPFSPGSDVAGVIKEVGDGVARVKPGDRVIAFTGWGGFAEQVIADANRLIPIPEEMDFVTASAFVMAYSTSYYALKNRAKLQPGETLLVLGAAGGVGLAAIELGKLMGAKVIAAASSDEKLAVCQEYGADHLINYEKEELKDSIKKITGGKGADVVYDPVGGNYSEAALRNTAWDGRFLVIGFANGEIPRIPLNLVLLKSCQIVGVFWGAFVEREPQLNKQYLDELMEMHRTGQIKPHISATYPMPEAAQALNDIMNRKVKGKAVLLVDPN